MKKASQLNDAQLPLNAALADFMDVVEKLALVKRDNRLADGSKETAADHIVKLCYLLLLACRLTCKIRGIMGVCCAWL